MSEFITWLENRDPELLEALDIAKGERALMGQQHREEASELALMQQTIAELERKLGQYTKLESEEDRIEVYNKVNTVYQNFQTSHSIHEYKNQNDLLKMAISILATGNKGRANIELMKQAGDIGNTIKNIKRLIDTAFEKRQIKYRGSFGFKDEDAPGAEQGMGVYQRGIGMATQNPERFRNPKYAGSPESLYSLSSKA
jgi:hypothetical protein